MFGSFETSHVRGSPGPKRDQAVVVEAGFTFLHTDIGTNSPCRARA